MWLLKIKITFVQYLYDLSIVKRTSYMKYSSFLGPDNADGYIEF